MPLRIRSRSSTVIRRAFGKLENHLAKRSVLRRRPRSTSCSTAAATNAFVTLAIRNGCAYFRAAWVCKFADPVTNRYSRRPGTRTPTATLGRLFSRAIRVIAASSRCVTLAEKSSGAVEAALLVQGAAPTMVIATEAAHKESRLYRHHRFVYAVKSTAINVRYRGIGGRTCKKSPKPLCVRRGAPGEPVSFRRPRGPRIKIETRAIRADIIRTWPISKSTDCYAQVAAGGLSIDIAGAAFKASPRSNKTKNALYT